MKTVILGILVAFLLALVASLGIALSVAANGGDTWYVDPSGTDDPSHGTAPGTGAFETIGQVSYGDTINVAAGTYGENITLKDGVALLGAGQGVSIIDGGGPGWGGRNGPTSQLADDYRDYRWGVGDRVGYLLVG